MSRKLLLQNAPKDIQPILSELLEMEEQLKEDYNEEKGKETKKQKEQFILQINTKRTRLIYDSMKNNVISYKTFQYCCKNNICDTKLIAQWKKTGYENLCCLQCIQNKKGTTNVCICRVPENQRKNKSFTYCQICGCKGCCTQSKKQCEMKNELIKKEIDNDGIETEMNENEIKEKRIEQEENNNQIIEEDDNNNNDENEEIKEENPMEIEKEYEKELRECEMKREQKVLEELRLKNIQEDINEIERIQSEQISNVINETNKENEPIQQIHNIDNNDIKDNNENDNKENNEEDDESEEIIPIQTSFKRFSKK